MKSVMTHDFSRIPRVGIERSTFDRSHGVKTAFDSGYLVPIFVDEVVPGDTFDVSMKALVRMSTPIVPIMDNVFIETQWFFVPSRLVWTNFTKMMGERINPRDSIDFLTPQIDSGTDGFAVGSLADYFGIPTGVPNLKVSALPFRCYAKIWDDWYRAEQIQDSIIQSTSDLDDTGGDIAWNTLLRRGKRHDYFTSALPSPQLGEGVEMPLGETAPVYGTGRTLALTDVSGDLIPDGATSARIFGLANAASYGLVPDHSVRPTLSSNKPGKALSTDATTANYNVGVGVPTKAQMDGISGGPLATGLTADLSHATAATINSLRTAFQVQRLLEADARAGTRYVSLIRQHFNTICPDARLQRSEFLGGSSQIINITPVMQTSSSDTTTPQGNLAAFASTLTDCKFVKSFTEHGFIIGLANVRADINYQQGLNRMWSRRGRYDYYFPTLAHLGEQAVLNKEIYAQGSEVTDSDGHIVDDLPFGYQERYAEYRYKPSIITGKLRSTASESLDVWHLAPVFNQLPTLSPEFIVDHPPIERALAVQDEPQFILDAYIGLKTSRPMPTYAIPGLVDHF